MGYTRDGKSTTITLLCVIFFIVKDLPVFVQAQPPCAPGNDINNRGDDKTISNDDEAVLMLTDGVIGCDGVIDRWHFYTGRRNDYIVRFQVWRPDAGGYRLVAENYLKFDGWALADRNTDLTWDVPVQYQIPVQAGDIIGWRNRDSNDDTTDDRSFRYDSPGFWYVLIMKSSYCTYTAGSLCLWSTLSNLVRKEMFQFSLRANVVAVNSGNVPYFLNLGQTITIKPNEPAGTLYYTVRASIENNAQDVYRPYPSLMYAITTGNPAACDLDYIIDGLSGEMRGRVPITADCVLTIQVMPLGGSPTSPETLIINVDNTDPVVDSVVLDSPPDTFIVNTLVDEEAIWKHDARCSGPCRSPPGEATTCHLLFSQPDYAPFDVGPLGDEMSTFNRFNNKIEIEDWQGPDTYFLTLACSTPYSTSSPAVLTATFTNLRLPPVSNLPALTSIVETQLDSDGDFYTVTGTDRSNNRAGGQPQYRLLAVYPRSSNDWFTVFTNGAVATAGPANNNLDYFIQKTYELEIVVEDSDFPLRGLQGEPGNLTVELSWVNREPGFPAAASFTASIPEKTAIGSPLPGILLDATDRDTQAPIDDWITYVISDVGTPPLGAHLFNANNITSLIYVERIISIDTPGVASVTYNMLVMALDSFGAASNQPALVVTVTDINDHAPVFFPKYYAGWVSEVDTGPTYVTTVSATDDDAGNNAQILYSILEREANEYFEIGTFSGDISLKQPISYVEYPNITFTVVATDQGVPALNGTATVFVVVNDTNTHRTVFEQDYYNVEVRSDLARGESVLQVVADDLDSDAVSSVTYYYLVIQEDFGLLNKTGNITVARKMKNYHKYILYLNARDLGVPNEYHTDPAYVRIDTFDAGEILLNIHLNLPLETFLSKQDDFMNELNILLSPWTVKFVKALLIEDITVVTIYVMSRTVAQDDMDTPKQFVHRNDVMKKLRTDKQGSPNEALRGPAFAAFEPIEVKPTYPDWMVDTLGGIATLSILCVLAAAAIPLALVLCKKKQWLCFKPKKTPTPKRPPPAQGSGQTSELKHGHNPNTVKPEKTSTYAGPLFQPPPPTYLPPSATNKAAIKESPIKPNNYQAVRTRPQHQWTPERPVTPVENPWG